MTAPEFEMRIRTHLSEEPWALILKRDPCVYCVRLESEIPGGTGRKWRVGGATKMTIEHIVPHGVGLVRPDRWMNKAPACWTCNHARGNQRLIAYLLFRMEAAARFAPGPNNARNRQWKADRRRSERTRQTATEQRAQNHGDRRNLHVDLRHAA